MNLNTDIFSDQPKPAGVGLIGFRYDQDSSFKRGAADAPPHIRKALSSASANLWSESGINLGQSGTLVDLGDVFCTSENARPKIEESISDVLEKRLVPLSLGGDHSITYAIIRAMAKRYRDLSILHIDAHPDLYDDFEGNRYSHASPFARIMEEQLVSHLLQVGIRTLNHHQREQAKRFAVEMVEMKDWRDDLIPRFRTPVYVSVDIDGLDPAYAPGVSHLEPGGLTTRQVLNLINRIEVPIVGADIVEFNPRVDLNGMTAMVCAKILKEIAAKMLSGS